MTARLWRWIGRRLCAVRGHNLLWHFEDGRVALECGDCGHQTRGWTCGTESAHQGRGEAVR